MGNNLFETAVNEGFLTVLCHNVYWFQGEPFATDRPEAPDERIVRELCARYRRLAPDVVCLQEIQDRRTFASVGEALAMEGTYCPGQTLSQYGGAIYWRPGTGALLADATGADPSPQRLWQVVEVTKSGRSWRIANLHLPSARQLGRAGAAARRLVELAQCLDSGVEAPAILAGDFNEPPGGAVTVMLHRRGYRDAAEATGQTARPTNLGGSRGDCLWVAAALAGPSLGYGVDDAGQLACDVPGKTHLSDHLPLWLRLGER